MSEPEPADGPPSRVHLRPTLLSDLDFVIQVETDSRNLPFITPWERPQHEGAVRFPDYRHFIVETGANYAPAGFVILQGCRNPHRSVELKRLVLATPARATGWAGPACGCSSRWPFAICTRTASGWM